MSGSLWSRSTPPKSSNPIRLNPSRKEQSCRFYEAQSDLPIPTERLMPNSTFPLGGYVMACQGEPASEGEVCRAPFSRMDFSSLAGPRPVEPKC